jgi:hypothetical protein
MTTKARAHGVLGALALGCALPGLWLDRPMFFAAWLAAAWCAVGIVLGAIGNGAMHRLTGGRWGEALRPATLALARRLPAALLALLVPAILGLHTLYPWAARPAGPWVDEIARPAFVRVWLQPPFFLVRVAGYAVAWWWLARVARRDPPGGGGRAALSLVLYGVVTSLAAVDLLMSLMPVWYSSVFGLAVVTGQLLAGAAVAVALATLQPGTALGPRPAGPEPRAAAAPPLTRDFGNLLLMWVLMWAYLAFVQLLIIWAENLPREIAWFLPRLQGGWRWLGAALVLVQFAVPLVALLLREVKDRPERLRWVAFALVAGGVLDAAWLVLPSVEPTSWAGWWLVPAFVAGIGLLVFGGVPGALKEAAAPRQELHHAGP